MVCRGVAAFVVAAGGLMPAPIAQASVFEMPAGQTSLLMVPVGDAGNAADTTGNGSVAYDYQIGEYDVTAAQYCQFLNATAATNDPYSLCMSNAVSSDNFNMTNDASEGITRSGTPATILLASRRGKPTIRRFTSPCTTRSALPTGSTTVRATAAPRRAPTRSPAAGPIGP